ncbi:MAG TPA: hypothetical protein VNA25_31095 [Phycisphaerae bacterium]|nr:hypothetical protein [Phycisphaerae bacterium]
MRTAAYPCLVMAAAFLVSCEKFKYEIEMAVQGEMLARQLCVSRSVTDKEGDKPETVPDEVVGRLAKLYEKHKPNEDGTRHTFRGRFKGRTPDDVGGAGFFTNLKTSMGSTVMYIERFRGSDDLLKQVNTRSQAVDKAMDLMIGWLETELGKTSDFDKLRKFLDKDLRYDLKNLSLYLWVLHSDASREVNAGKEENTTKAQAEIAARAIQYLLERDYVKAQDVPLVYRVQQTEASAQVKALVALLGRIIAAKAGAATPATLEKISSLAADGDAAGASLVKYLSQTDEYKQRVKQWEQRPNSDPNEAKPAPMSMLSDYATQAVGIELMATEDDLQIKLACPSNPLQTNGKYDELAKVLSWSRQIQQASQHPRMPVLCYAVWAKPDEDSQKKHFGRTVLRGEELLEYCLWHDSLDAKEAAKWDRFVASLAPGPKLEEKLDAFKLVEPPPVPPEKVELEAPPEDYSEVAKRLIIQGLSSGAATTQPAPKPAPQ